MKNYQNEIHAIRTALEKPDNNPEYNEEKYDAMLDDLVSLIKKSLTDNTLTQADKQHVFSEAASLLAHYIGCADDVEKYLPQIEALYSEGLISEQQLDFFDENMNIGRWR